MGAGTNRQSNQGQQNNSTTGERALQEQIDRVRDYNTNVFFFNLLIPPLMLQEWSLVGDAEQELDFMGSYRLTLEAKIHALFRRFGLPVPEPITEASILAETNNDTAETEVNPAIAET